MGDMTWLVAVGVIWGVTNPFIKRGSTIVAQRKAAKKSTPGGDWPSKHVESDVRSKNAVVQFAGFWKDLLSNLEYTVPFVLNLCGSLLFFLTLPDVNISVAVPMSNAITFTVTALVGSLLGEKINPLFAGPGVLLTLLGVYVCLGPDLFDATRSQL